MANQSFTKSVLKKTTLGIIIGVILVVAAQQTHFPQVFQIMFFIYAMLGAFVFILLDAPAMKRLEGIKAVVALVVFYVLLSGLYIAGASILPQFDPNLLVTPFLVGTVFFKEFGSLLNRISLIGIIHRSGCTLKSISYLSANRLNKLTLIQLQDHFGICAAVNYIISIFRNLSVSLHHFIRLSFYNRKFYLQCPI